MASNCLRIPSKAESPPLPALASLVRIVLKKVSLSRVAAFARLSPEGTSRPSLAKRAATSWGCRGDGAGGGRELAMAKLKRAEAATGAGAGGAAAAGKRGAGMG